jgi:hypothetical protein
VGLDEAQVATKQSVNPWLLFIHQIPKEPAYLRVKVGRRLGALGAVAVKNSVYVLPNRDACREDFSWLRREILDGGGDAATFEANAIEGFTTSDLERLFREARKQDYERLGEKVTDLEKIVANGTPSSRQSLLADLARLEEQAGEIERMDFFSQHEAVALRERIGGARTQVEQRKGARPPKAAVLDVADYQGRTWVTREGVKVDRIACAWLIRRFIDKHPKFRFVDATRYVPKKGELRFDMPEGEFTHQGDLCSFEVMCLRFGIDAGGIRRVAENIHDLDVKDGRHGHPEVEGIRVMIEGLVATHAVDIARIDAASLLFDALCAAHPTQKGKRGR